MKQAGDAGRMIGLIFGAVVAGVAAIASYTHMQVLVEKFSHADEQWLSWLIPLSVDGMMVLSSISLVKAQLRDKNDVPFLPVTGIVTGLAVSIAANIAAAGPTPEAKLINLWPPVALALSYELMLKLLRTVDITVDMSTNASESTSPAVVSAPAVEEVSTSAVPEPRAAADDDGTATPSAPAPGTARPKPSTGLHLVTPKPDWLTHDMTAREAMFRYLDESPDATGAELDRFGMEHLGTKKDYGRGVRRAWEKQLSKASGE